MKTLFSMEKKEIKKQNKKKQGKLEKIENF